MRCLQHVLWRGAVALALLVSAGTGAVLSPPPATLACDAVLRSAQSKQATAVLPTTPGRAIALTGHMHKATSSRGTC